MKITFYKSLRYLTMACLIFCFLCFGDSKDAMAATTKYVTASTLSIRKTPSSSGTKVGSYKKGTKVTCYGTKGNWTKVKYKGYYR